MGPLEGVRFVELAGIGPGPFCAMLLSDMGADVIRVDRADAVTVPVPAEPPFDVMLRGRRSIAVDLKQGGGRDIVLKLVAEADGLLEGFRPGVTERLGIGPAECLAANPRLVYGRMTGWGQDGPLAERAGHDIDYIALSGVLHAIGRRGEPPVPPLNLVGDFGGGGLVLAFGMACALFEATRSGKGQVVDASMVEGSALLATSFHALQRLGMWSEERGANLLDTGAPFYDVYRTLDGRHMAVGALEPQFFSELLLGLGLSQEEVGVQSDRARWPPMRDLFAERFRSRTQDEWTEVFEGTDACVAPVLSTSEAARHPHNIARGTFVDAYGVSQPAPAPRFSRTPAGPPGLPPHPGQHTDEILAELGFTEDEIAARRSSGAVH